MERAATDRRSRRALLTGAAAGIAAVGLRSVILPTEAEAAADGPIIMGQINETNTSTRIYGPSFSGKVTTVQLNQSAIAVIGSSTANDGTGVHGAASGNSGVAVRGETDGHHSTVGVSGISDPEGIAVKGKTKNGTGVWAEATGGHALRVRGRAVFDRSGRITFAKGQATKTISNKFVGDGGIVLATIQANVAGTWVRGVSLDIAHDKFTIRLNKAAPKQLQVGWFIVN